jgi:hypothetical protein
MFPWTMLLFVLATIPTLLAIPVWTTAASGAVLSCGQTITQNTVLDNDLTGCTNNGIVIGADNITLNLNGHIISGTPNTGDQAGVALVGRTGGTVRNGTVRAFDVGVVIEGGSGTTVQAIQAIGNISFENAPRRGGDGIAILSSRNNRIVQNMTVNNGPYSGIGIYSEVDSAHPRATRGVSSGNVLDFRSVGLMTAKSRRDAPVRDDPGLRENGATVSRPGGRGPA